MKIKISIKTIETILWLLGQLITLMKQVSKDNKDNEFGEIFKEGSNSFLKIKNELSLYKMLKKKEDNEQEKNKENTKGN